MNYIYQNGRGGKNIYPPYKEHYQESDSKRLTTNSYDKSKELEQQVDTYADMNDGLHSKIREQSFLITQYSDQEKIIGGLQNEISELQKQLKTVKKQNSQLHLDVLDDKRANKIERDLEMRRKYFQEDLRQQTLKIGQISDTCDQLRIGQKVQNDKIKQKNEEIKELLEENDQLRRIKKEYNEQNFKIESLEKENADLKNLIKNLQDEKDQFQTEKKDSQQKLKEEITKLKIENSDLMETINTQLAEISDCINMANKYKEIILNQQKNLEVNSQKNQEINDIILSLDELVRSSARQKNQYLVFQGDASNTYDILYILKNNIITFTKSYQDLKHQKNKYKNKSSNLQDEIKDLKQTQKLNKIEIEQLKTEKLILEQQFEQTVVTMEQQINERNVEEMKLKQQLNEISSQIQNLDKEMEDKEFKKYQVTSHQFGSYVNVMHSKMGKLLNIKQICSSFITGYLKLIDKINNLSKQLQICQNYPLNSIKQRALRKLKKIFKVVYFATLIKSRRCLTKTDLNTVGQILRQSQKGIPFIEKLDLQREFGSIIIQLNVQQQEYYPQILNQQESTKICNQIEQNIQSKICNKDEEIAILQQKFIKISEEIQTFQQERESDQKLIQELRKNIQEQDFELKRAQEESVALNERLKFHRKNFVDSNRDSGQFQSQDNLFQNNLGNNNLNGNYQSINRNNFEEGQPKLTPSMIGSRNASQELLSKFKFNESNFESQLVSPIVKNSNSKFGSIDFLKMQQPSQRNSNNYNNNIYIDQNDRQQQLNTQQLTSDKKQAYLELKKQQQELQDKLASNQNDIERIRSNSQSQFKSESKRNSIETLQQSLNQNKQLNELQNQLINQRNLSNFTKNLQGQPQPGFQSIRTNSINNQSSFAQLNNNYTFNNNSQAQLILSDSQRKTKTIQDQIKQELLESQKFSKFLTQQQ